MKLFEANKKKHTNSAPVIEYADSGLSWNGIPIEISFRPEESRAHIQEDFAVLESCGIETLIRERFLPWLKTENFADLDDERIMEGLKLTGILYTYGRIVARYSPTGEDDMFGQFEFDFASSGPYTEQLLEASAMQVYVKDKKIVKVSGYDI